MRCSFPNGTVDQFCQAVKTWYWVHCGMKNANGRRVTQRKFMPLQQRTASWQEHEAHGGSSCSHERLRLQYLYFCTPISEDPIHNYHLKPLSPPQVHLKIQSYTNFSPLLSKPLLFPCSKVTKETLKNVLNSLP